MVDTDPVTLAAFVNPTIDAGVVPPPSVSVGDYVWIDANGDGLQDSTDVPLEGVTLAITTSTGGPVTDVFGRSVSTTTTDSSGHYSFDWLPFGTYKVTVTPPAGCLPTTANVGSNRAVDSATGSATSVALTSAGQRDGSLDFGFVRVATPDAGRGDQPTIDPVVDENIDSSDDGRTTDGGTSVHRVRRHARGWCGGGTARRWCGAGVARSTPTQGVSRPERLVRSGQRATPTSAEVGPDPPVSM